MEFLQRLQLPRRLAARVWLLTVPSGLLSFERRQRIPKMPIGRGRFVGLLLIAAGMAAVVRSGQIGALSGALPHSLARFREKPAVGGGLLALGGAGVLMRSLVVTAYALGLAFAFARDTVDLEEPQLPGRDSSDDSFEYDEAQV
jgi:hypothetical protein